MKRLSLIFIFILLDYCVLVGQDNWGTKNVIQKFYSPTKKNLIIYRGADSFGDGKYYHGEISDSNLIYEGNQRYGPKCYWVNHEVAEIYISTGSPNNFSYFYNYRKKILSNSFSLEIATDSLNLVVACLDINKIKFYDIFSDSLLVEYKLDGLDPIGFLTICRHEQYFDTNGNFHFKYECMNSKDIKAIKKQKDEIIIYLNKK